MEEDSRILLGIHRGQRSRAAMSCHMRRLLQSPVYAESATCSVTVLETDDEHPPEIEKTWVVVAAFDGVVVVDDGDDEGDVDEESVEGDEGRGCTANARRLCWAELRDYVSTTSYPD